MELTADSVEYRAGQGESPAEGGPSGEDATSRVEESYSVEGRV
jgi:hypothetical protein